MSRVEQDHEEVLLSCVPQTGMEVVVDVGRAANHGSGLQPASREPSPDLERRAQARALGGTDPLGSTELAASRVGQALQSAVTAEQIRRGGKRAATATARAQQERDELRIERDNALEVRDFLEEVFSGVDPGEARGETVTAREILDKGAARVMAELAEQPETQAALALAIGRVYVSLGLNDRAQPLLERSLEQRLQLHGERHLDVADSLMALSVLHQNRADFAAAEAAQRRALVIQRGLLGATDARLGDTLTDLSVTLLAMARYAEAETIVREALAIHRQSSGKEEGVAYDLNNLASVLRRTGRLSEAEGVYREALAIARRIFGPAHPQLTRSINNLAVVLNDEGDLAAAEPLMREALSMTRKLYGEEHPDVALQLSNLASMLGARGDADGWVELARQALDMRRRLFGPEHEQVASSLVNLGNALEHGGNHVRVELHGHNGEAVLAVADDGAGISESAVGTGLSIVRALVRDELRGTLELSGDGGTRAEVRFPVSS